jgi:1-acyl-sn-glycerol-3-phosphate acyltransferase
MPFTHIQGEHVLIDRTTKRSQFRSFKQAITYLQNGVPIMAFPEGARSPDGRLMSFKGGIFSMAVKAKVPIVPLSLSNTHAVMPGVGLMPVQSGKGKLRVFVHSPICVEGKSEEEIAGEVRKALLSELPVDQHPLEEREGEI